MTFDCQKCGACCLSFDVVLLSQAECDAYERNPRLLSLTVIHPVGGAQWRFMARTQETGQCMALGGKLGDCGCTIYEDRPDLCRKFPSGGPECIEVRKKFGMSITGDGFAPKA